MNDTEFPRCSLLAHWLGRAIIRLSGWKVAGQVPTSNRMVVIAAPHTSNWDLLFLLGAAYSLNLSINWLGKDALFKRGLGPIMRYLGGIPVDRSKHNNLVDQLVEEIGRRDGCAIVVPPAGTRSYTEYWKSGFYWIASGAKIPLVCGYLDYEKKIAGLGPSFVPTGDVGSDMDRLREFYTPIAGRYPEKESTIRLREES
jgi:1-acyl-sn-glycerol-3-phosphate acyltransferase